MRATILVTTLAILCGCLGSETIWTITDQNADHNLPSGFSFTLVPVTKDDEEKMYLEATHETESNFDETYWEIVNGDKGIIEIDTIDDLPMALRVEAYHGPFGGRELYQHYYRRLPFHAINKHHVYIFPIRITSTNEKMLAIQSDNVDAKGERHGGVAHGSSN